VFVALFAGKIIGKRLQLSSWNFSSRLAVILGQQVALLSQRGRAMLRVSQYCSKLIVQNVERTLLLFSYLRFRFTAAYTIKISVLFSSLRRGRPCCRLWYTKIHGCVAVCAVNCTVDRLSCCSHSTGHRSIASYSSRIASFAYPTCIPRPHFVGPRRNIVMTLGMEKRTDGQILHGGIGLACTASRGKNAAT